MKALSGKPRLAKIIPIRPEVNRNCSQCDNAYLGVNGIICEITMDFVFSETIAMDCEFYEKGNSVA